ncbi:MAG: hypothetical protein ACOYBQ_08460 [Fluviibacter sp.]
MKRLLLAALLLASGLASAQSIGALYPINSTPWDASPLNWNNLSQNWDNSPSNWKNSPTNWENSQTNNTSRNGVYDTQGNRVGYTVRTPSGVTNVFTNDGRRVAFAPGHAEDTDSMNRPMPTVRRGFTPIEEVVVVVPRKSGFTPLRSGFTPLQ